MAICDAPPNEPALVFVPSRSQCHNVAADLITRCAIDMKTMGFLGKSTAPEALEPYLSRLQNDALHDIISHGIGIFHEGIHRSDLSLILQLYLEGIIRVLVAPRETCWTVPVHAGVVIVLGTQYVRVSSGSERQIQGYTMQEIVKMQSCAIRPGKYSAFYLFCQAEQQDMFMRLLSEGLPLESELMDSNNVKNWFEKINKTGSITGKQDCLDILSFTYLSRRISTNPAYYDADVGRKRPHLSRFIDTIWG
jgi:antiviral helicase SLH1